MTSYLDRMTEVGLLIFFLSCSAQMQAGTEVSKDRTQAEQVFANFVYEDASSGVVTSVFLSAFTARIKDGPGNPDSFPRLSILISQNESDGDPLLVAFGAIEDFVLDIEPNLKSAFVQAVLPLTDLVTGKSLNASIKIDWTPTGPKEVVNDVSHFSFPPLTIHRQSHGKAREAQAAGFVFADGINYISLPSVDARIEDLNLGQTVIEKN